MVAGATISAELSDEAWLDALKDVSGQSGTYSDLGESHAALYVEQSQKVLFVAFETLAGIRSISERGLPLAFDVCERRNWSHLSLITRTQDWYRDRRVYRFFDRLIDFGFFDNFDQVVFYGAGMCGYAAAAFSVAAPGAKVLLVAPQATLERSRTPWDSRYPSSRRTDFGGRYAYAPEMLEAAGQAFIFYNPEEIEDAMHASLFQGPDIHHYRYRRGSAGAIEADLRAMSLISQLADKAVSETLTPASLARTLRVRRRHVPYLRALLSRVLSEDRPQLTAQLCRAVLAEQPLPRFKEHLERAERQLGKRPAPSPDTDFGAEGA